MGTANTKQTQQIQYGQSKDKKKRYAIENTHNFQCYQSLRLLVSEPTKYFAVHAVIICAMIYFYVLTFVTKLIVYEINYFVIALHIIVFVLMTILGFKNPGFVLKIQEDFDTPTKIAIPFDRDSKPAINQLAKSYAIAIKSHLMKLSFCSECLIYKPPRTVHCWVCNACIVKMDHHCPFIGSCIGKGNYQIFFGYIFSLTIMVILMIVQLVILIVRLFQTDHIDAFKRVELYFALALSIFGVVTFTFVGSLTGFHIFLVINSLTTNQLCKKTWNTVSGSPFRKNFCFKNILRFIRGPSDQSLHHSHEMFQKSMIPRFKDKSEQYLSSYSSEPKQYAAASQLRQISLQKPSADESSKQMGRTQSNIIPFQKRSTSI